MLDCMLEWGVTARRLEVITETGRRRWFSKDRDWPARHCPSDGRNQAGRLPHSTRSKGRSAAAARRSAVSCVSRKAGRWLMPSKLGCASSWPSSAKDQRRRDPLRPLALAEPDASSMTAASNSTTTRSNDQSVASSSVARTRCLPDPTRAAGVRLRSTPSSPLPSSAPTTHRLGSPTC